MEAESKMIQSKLIRSFTIQKLYTRRRQGSVDFKSIYRKTKTGGEQILSINGEYNMFADITDKLYQRISGSRQGYDVIEYYIAYDKGSYNYWYSQTNTRGYYLHATPMKRCGAVNSYTLMGDEAGGKMKILDVETRRSKKTDGEAVKEANEYLEQIANHIAAKCGYTLGEFTK